MVNHIELREKYLTHKDLKTRLKFLETEIKLLHVQFSEKRKRENATTIDA